MDHMDDEGMRKGVIDQMMGELDDVTADHLRKPKGPVKGVEIAITVSPKSEDEMEEEMEEHGACMDDECEDPEHDHAMRDAEKKEKEPESDYISQLCFIFQLSQ